MHLCSNATPWSASRRVGTLWPYVRIDRWDQLGEHGPKRRSRRVGTALQGVDLCLPLLVFKEFALK